MKNDSIGLNLALTNLVLILFLQAIAVSVGDWYFDRVGVKAIDCAYPCDTTCHNLVFK